MCANPEPTSRPQAAPIKREGMNSPPDIDNPKVLAASTKYSGIKIANVMSLWEPITITYD